MLARDELGATANFAGDWRVSICKRFCCFLADFCYCTIVEQRLPWPACPELLNPGWHSCVRSGSGLRLLSLGVLPSGPICE